MMENVFQQCVREARDRGATVLLSSHILAETEALCDRLTIIRAGRTVETGTLKSLRHLSRTSIRAEMVRDPGDVRGMPGVADASYDGTILHAQVDSANLGDLIRLLGDAGCAVWRVVRPPSRICSCSTMTSPPNPTGCAHEQHDTAAAGRTREPPPASDRQSRRNPWATADSTPTRPDRAATVGAAAVGAAGHGLHRQHRRGVPDAVLSHGSGGVDHGQPGAARVVRQRLQRQPRRGRHLEGVDLPPADRRGGHPDRDPPYPRRRGGGPHRARRHVRRRPLREPDGHPAAGVRRRRGDGSDRLRRTRHDRCPIGRFGRVLPRTVGFGVGVHGRGRGRGNCRRAHASRAASRSVSWPRRSRCARWAMQAPPGCPGCRRWAGHCRCDPMPGTAGGCCCCTWARLRC